MIYLVVILLKLKGEIYMNIQAMMKQAQALQNDMLKIKKEVDNTEFSSENELVKVVMTGDKKITGIVYKVDSSFSFDDTDVLADMTMLAINDTVKKIDAELEKKMGKFGNVAGLF